MKNRKKGGCMRKLSYCSVILSLMLLVCAQCAMKTAWAGQHIMLTYTKYPPKEDFKAASYVVVAYDVRSIDKFSDVVYRFEMYINEKKMGALELCDRNVVIGFLEPGFEYEYFLLAGDSRTPSKDFYLRQLHKKYEGIPEYSILKNDVIEVLESE
jgi:hypothetical protein